MRSKFLGSKSLGCNLTVTKNADSGAKTAWVEIQVLPFTHYVNLDKSTSGLSFLQVTCDINAYILYISSYI